MALVSVVVPTHDRKEFLEDSVESVLQQTYPELELIVVDGGSTDGTLEFLGSIADERLRVVAHDHPLGLGAARNAGLEASSGEYVVFLDDDDRLLEGAIAALVEAIRDRPRNCAGVYTAHRNVYESDGRDHGRTVGDNDPDRATGGDDEKRVAGGKVERYEDASIGGPSCTLIRSEVVDEVGRFDESFSAHEDSDFWIRLFSEFHMVALDRVLYERRYHDGQMTTDTGAMLRAKTRLLEKHDDRFSDAWLAREYRRIATSYARLGRPGLARERLRDAVRLDSLERGALYYYFWLQFGTAGYSLARLGHDRIYRPLYDYLASSSR